MTTLISFLGKSQLDGKQGYRTARYCFPDGGGCETSYFGLALAEHLGAERLILIGTASSMWDVLVESVVGDVAQEELRIELMDAVRAQEVTESLLGRLAPAIEARLGRAMRPIVIPHSTRFAEQQVLLQRLADELARGERVVLDVTHGFRHLAMLALTAARYLAHERGVAIQALYYGALDMTEEGVTPVVELSGLAHAQEWAEALAAYEASGDFSRFAPLLARDGLAAAQVEALARGWHFVCVNNVADAARALQPVYQALRQPLTGASELFREKLRRSLRWVAADAISERQRLLALQALRRDDVLRAALFGFESFVSREVEEAGAEPLDFHAREHAEARYRRELKEGEHADWKRAAFWLLKNVRNALAHGTRPDYPPHAQLLQNPQRLREKLEQTLNRLTNTP